QPVRCHPISEATGKVWQVRSVCAGQDSAFENGVRLRHGTGCEESVCLAAVSRLHRIAGVQILAGASLPRGVRGGVERRAYPRGYGGGFLSLRSQPADSANDEGGPANP